MRDIFKAKAVKVQIDPLGQRLWVCVDGVCVLRCARMEHFEIDDMRKSLEIEPDEEEEEEEAVPPYCCNPGDCKAGTIVGSVSRIVVECNEADCVTAFLRNQSDEEIRE